MADESNFRARVEAIKARHREKAKEARRRAKEQPRSEDELFAVPKVKLANPPIKIDTTRPKSSTSADQIEKQSASVGAGENSGAELNIETANLATTTTGGKPALQLDTQSTEPQKEKQLSSEKPKSAPQSPVTATRAQAATLAQLGRIKKRPRVEDSSSTTIISSVATDMIVGSSQEATQQFEAGIIPAWYRNAKRPKITPEERRTWDKLKDLSNLITRCEKAQGNAIDFQKTTAELYSEIDDLRFTDVTAFGLKIAKVFEPEHGLPRIHNPKFSKGVPYPQWVISDAKGLHKRWLAQILDGSNMFRGIQNMVKAGSGQVASIDNAYKLDWRFHGEGHLVNSDWFANQLCALRDGAHGSAQGGISGIAESGATSISLSGDLYKDTDRDELNEIWYSGTPQARSGEKEETANTKLLLKSASTKEPIRVLRSANLPNTNPYRPERGFRYDGLYKVAGRQLVDKGKHHYVFHLVRIEGQDPVRYQGIEKRPTQKEIATYDHEMKMFGKKKG